MTEFSKKLNEATSRIRETAQRDKNLADAKRHDELIFQTAREDRIARGHGIAMRFCEKCIQPLMKEIQTKVPGAVGYNRSQQQDGFAGWELGFGDTDYLALRISFDDRHVWLSAQAACRELGIFYSERSTVFDYAQFDENVAKSWIQERALEAYEALGEKSGVFRNAGPIMTYNGAPLE